MLVGVSGGADSMALLRALLALSVELELDVEAATIDHGLRAGSAAEHRRVEAAILALGVPCARESLALPGGSGVQRRARDARYAALARIAEERGCDAVAVAHTLDDQAETVLARVLRGTGVRGLAGALRRRDDAVVRPLLDVRRAEVMAYLEAIHQPVLVEDPSNADERYLRVRIRRRLLPTLEAEQPNLARMLAHLADDAAEHRALVEREARAVADRGAPEPPSQVWLASLPAPVRRQALRSFAEAHGATLGRSHLEALERLCLAGRGEVLLSGGKTILIDGGALALVEKPNFRTKREREGGA